MYKLTINLLLIIAAWQYAAAQVQLSPRISVNGEVKAFARRGDTLIVGGAFSNAGIYTGGGALFNSSSHTPHLSFPKIIGDVYCSTPDGNGGFYIYGSYRREQEPPAAVSARIEHVLPNFTFEPGFSLSVNALFRLNAMLYHNGVLYLGGNYVSQIAGQNAGNLCAVNVATKQLLSWMPAVNGQVSALFARENLLYVTGGFTTIGGESRNGLAAIDVNTGSIRPWNPPLGGGYSDIKFYKDRIVIGGGFHDASFNNHACALVDSVSGTAVQYIFNANNLYWAAGVSKMALRGDTLFTFSTGTADTRVTAVRLTDNTIVWKKYFNMIAQASALEVIDTALFVSGSAFSGIYRTNATNNNPADMERSIYGAVKLDVHTGNLEQWFPDAAGAITSDVTTMSVTGRNVFLGGNFSHVNAQVRHGILMLNTATDELLPFSMGLDYFSRDVNALKLIDSTLYVAGNFAKLNGQPYAASVIACNVRTGQILPWHPANLGNAWALEANHQYVFIAGALSDGGGRGNLFAIDRQTGALANWSPNPDGYVGAQSLHVSKGRLYVGGNFDNISGQPRHRIACYDTATLSLTAWQPLVSGNVTSIASADTVIWLGAAVYKGNGLFTKLFAGCSAQSGDVVIDPFDAATTSGVVNEMIVTGRYVIAGGTFAVNGGPCNNLRLYDMLNKRMVPDNSFCQSFSNGGGIKAMSLRDDELYIGGNFVNLNDRLNSSNIERIKFPSGYFDAGAAADTSYSFYPREGGNGGDVTIHFYGPLIQAGMKVKLAAAGMPDITVPDTMVFFSAGQELRARVNLRGQRIGNYDVVLTTADGTEYRTPKGFTVMPFERPDIMVNILGPNLIRTGRKNAFIIQVNNNGNCDAVGVPIILFVSGDVKVNILDTVLALDGSPVDSVSYFELDSLNGQNLRTRAYWFLVDQVVAGSIRNFSIEIEPQVNDQNILIKAIANDPYFASPLGERVKGCMQELADKIADDVDVCREAANYERFLNNFDRFYENGIRLSNPHLADLRKDLVNLYKSCQTGINIAKSIKRNWYLTLLKLGFIGLGKMKDYDPQKCEDVFDGDGNSSTHNTASRNSIDPNDKIGIGVTARHYVTGRQPFQYGIRFENLATASLPAQVVKVVDTLDKASLDLSTFQLTLITVGGKYFPVGPGQKAKVQHIDLRPQINLVLQISAVLEENTGVFTAEFISLDPITLLPTANPLLGFLPPNVHAPQGEGAVYFSVHPKADLPNKYVVSNKALIWFDANAPIATPVWINTIDKLAPVSKVTVQATDTTIRLTWNGADNESGIEYYNVYYAVNGGAFRPLMRRTGQTAMSFIGKADSSYAFYSVAVDSVGNAEQKSMADATVTITGGEINIYPNPSSGTFIVHAKATSLQLYDMQGREIAIAYTGANNVFRVTVKQLTPPGIYVVKIVTNGQTISRKIMLK